MAFPRPMDPLQSTKTSRPRQLIGVAWRLFAAAVAPFVIDSAWLFWTGWLYHGSGNHSATPAFITGIVVGGCFVMTLPLRWSIRIFFLLLYFLCIPLVWAALIPYSLWFLAVFFHAMVPGG